MIEDRTPLSELRANALAAALVLLTVMAGAWIVMWVWDMNRLAPTDAQWQQLQACAATLRTADDRERFICDVARHGWAEQC